MLKSTYLVLSSYARTLDWRHRLLELGMTSRVVQRRPTSRLPTLPVLLVRPPSQCRVRSLRPTKALLFWSRVYLVCPTAPPMSSTHYYQILLRSMLIMPPTMVGPISRLVPSVPTSNLTWVRMHRPVFVSHVHAHFHTGSDGQQVETEDPNGAQDPPPMNGNWHIAPLIICAHVRRF